MTSHLRRGIIIFLILASFGGNAAGAILWKGRLRIISAVPWKIEILENRWGNTSNPGPEKYYRTDKTGLPEITEDYWICTGRLPTNEDVGKEFDFIGTIPDIGGHLSFTAQEDPSIQFRSKWFQPRDFRKPFYFGLAIMIISILGLALTVRYVWKRARGH